MLIIPLLLAASAAAAAGPGTLLVAKGDRVAIAGDSITEQKIYSRYIEDYLLACVPQLDLSVMQFGWSGETAPGFLARMENDLLPYRPDLVTTCYGMNDGRYRAYEESIGNDYADAMRAIAARLTDEKIRVVVGSPGVVDSTTFGGGNKDAAKVYNDNLAHLRDIARRVADEEGAHFADVNDPMMREMEQAKAKYGDDYHVAGSDGVHPWQNGQLVMAYAFLAAMGFDGDIGTITIDLKGKATATDGHRVLSASGGKVELESTRYPFCFYGDGVSPDSERSILPFVPFNRELNRLTLIVKNLGSEKAQVTWGTLTKEFGRSQLESGVNLAGEFLDNPFSEPFQKLDAVVQGKQGFETYMVKQVITNFRYLREVLGDDPEVANAMSVLRAKLFAEQAQLQAQARAAVVAVRHTIVVVPR
jgi:lysophospholipase L1-like esterase